MAVKLSKALKQFDHTGQRFTRLKVIKKVENGKKGAFWECLCDCGNTKIVKGANLRSKQIRSALVGSKRYAKARAFDLTGRNSAG